MYGKLTHLIKSILVAGLLVACVSEEEPPENLLPREDIVDVLIQVHLLEAKVDNFLSRKDSSQALYDHYEAILFERMQIDKAQYDATMQYYLNRPGDLNSIYETVVDSLSLRAKNRNID